MSATTRAAPFVAAVVAALVYFNALGNGFAYDDVPVVVEDPALTTPGAFPERLAEPFWPGSRGTELGLWRPLTTAAFALQARAAGLEPALFHGVNVLVHAGATALVALLAASFVPPAAALLAGLLFAVHPVHVEAVANVVGLSELLSAFFYLAACVLFLRWTARPVPADPATAADAAPPAAPGPARLAALALLYAAAFLAKESAATLPAALLLLDLVRSPVRLRDAGAWLRRRASLVLVLAAVAGAVLLARWAVLGSVADPDPPLGAHRLADVPRTPTLAVVWLHWVRLLFAPFDLSADYGPGVVPVLTVWTPAAAAGAAVALLLLAACLVAWRRGHRLPAFAALWLAVTIAPVSNVFFLSGVLLAERTLYLPSVGFAVAAGAGLAWLSPPSSPGAGAWRRALAPAAVAAVLLLFAARTWTRTPVWHDTERALLTLAADHPASGRARWMVGDLLAARGDLPRAKRRWAEAVALLDSSPDLLRELGREALARGEPRLGEHLLRRAMHDDPASLEPPRRLALLHARQGRHDEAAALARRVVDRQPADAAFWHVLATSLEATGDVEGALDARGRVIALGEDPWQQWHALARLRLAAGDSAGAAEAVGEALARAPGEAEREVIRAVLGPSGGA